MAQLEPGALVGGCEIIHLLGRGGMGNVYLARQLTLNRQVALKVIRPELDPDQIAAFHSRFEREARALATFDHPQILPVYDFGTVMMTDGSETDTVSYLVMAYVTGGSLFDYLAEKGGMLSPQETLAVLDQIASGLQHAHDKGIIHRDLKPQNILRYPDGRLVIADFGLARSGLAPASGLTTVQRPSKSDVHTAPETSGSMGTPRYMAPEHLRGHAEFRSDLYSLGVMLYQMLTGVFPFEGEPIQVAIAHLQDAPASLRQHRPDLPAAVEAVVLRCLEKNPDNRYQSARELAAAFRSAVQGDSASATTAPGNSFLATASSGPSDPTYPGFAASTPASHITFSPTPPGVTIPPGRANEQREMQTPELPLAPQGSPGKQAHLGETAPPPASAARLPWRSIALPWYRRRGVLWGIGALVLASIGAAALIPFLPGVRLGVTPTAIPLSAPAGQFSAPAEGSATGNVIVLLGTVSCESGLTGYHLEQNNTVIFDQRLHGERRAAISYQLNLTGQAGGPQEFRIVAQCRGSAAYQDTGARLHLLNDSATGACTAPATGALISGSSLHLTCTVSYPAGIGSIHITANPGGQGWRLLLNKRYHGEKQITLDTVLDLSALPNGEIQLGLDATTQEGKSRLGIAHLLITKKTP